MSYDVVPGSESEAYQAMKAREEFLMCIGAAGRTIYLNGGSETRRAVREFWAEYARDRNIGFRTYGGCIVVVGGPAERRQ